MSAASVETTLKSLPEVSRAGGNSDMSASPNWPDAERSGRYPLHSMNINKIATTAQLVRVLHQVAGGTKYPKARLNAVDGSARNTWKEYFGFTLQKLRIELNRYSNLICSCHTRP